MKKSLWIISIFTLAACGATQKIVEDTTPVNKTVVLTGKGVINGYVLPNSTFNQQVYTRNDKRIISMQGEFDSWMARQFFGGIKKSSIYRMDKNLLWELSDKKGEKKYLECQLSGCKNKILAQLSNSKDQQNDDQFDYDPEQENECKLTLYKNSFTVTSTGEQRQIAGYSTKEYKATWLVEYKDEKGRTDTNTLNIVFWNTEPTKTINEMWEIHGQATKNYLAKVKQENNPLAKYLPDEMFMALSAFSGDTSKDSQKWKSNVAKQLAKAEGFPMSIKTEWYLDRKACAETKPEKKSLDWSNPLQALKDSATDYTSKQAEKMFMPNPNEPIFRYIYDVTSVDIKTVHDSVFEVPTGYTLVSRE